MKKYLRLIPLLIIIIAILLLTVQKPTDTKALSSGTRQVLVRIGEKLGIDTDAEWWNTSNTVRSLGHTIEYFVLGLGAGIAFKKKRYAVIVCACISFADQMVKILVPTRHFDWNDLPFDIVGYGSAILITWVIGMARRSLNRLDEEEV